MKSGLRCSIDRRWVCLLALVLLGLPLEAEAQEEEPCLMCHSLTAMFQTTGDPDRFVVTPESLEGSVHGALGCPVRPAIRIWPTPTRREPKPRAHLAMRDLRPSLRRACTDTPESEETIGLLTAHAATVATRSCPARTPGHPRTRSGSPTPVLSVTERLDF